MKNKKNTKKEIPITKRLIESIVKEECSCQAEPGLQEADNEAEEKIDEQMMAVPSFQASPEQIADAIANQAMQNLISLNADKLQELLGDNYTSLYFSMSLDKLNAALFKAVLKQVENGWNAISNH